MEKISYASELWKQKQKKAIQEQCYKQLLHELSEYIVDFVSLDSYDPIDFYDTLSSIYSELAEYCYLETEDLEESRLYYYLVAKTGEMTFLLLEKGVPTFSASKESISKNEGAVWYALCAILAGEHDLAMRLVPQGTVLGNLLEGKNFEQSLWGKKIVFVFLKSTSEISNPTHSITRMPVPSKSVIIARSPVLVQLMEFFLAP